LLYFHNELITGLDPKYWIGAGTPYQWQDSWWLTDQQPVNRDRAAFGEGYWDITSKLTMTLGIRRFYYDNTTEGFNGFGLNAFNSNPNLLTPAELLAANPNFRLQTGQQTCINDTPFHGAPCSDIRQRATGEGWTPKYNFAYKFDPDRMMYVTYSKGYRPGGVNRFAGAPPFGADFLKNYEMGWKTSWFDNHLRWNGALYYEKWDNFQFQFSGPNSAGVTANAAKADVKGIDTDVDWAVTRGLTLSAAATFTDAQLRANYCGELDAAGQPITTNPCPPKRAGGASFVPTALDGQQLPLSPRWKGSLTARYTFPMLGEEGHLQGNYTYQSLIWPTLLNTERAVLGSIGGYGVANFTFGIDRANYTLDLIVKNAFDVEGGLSRSAECSITVCGKYATYNQIVRPRLIGLQFGQRF